MGRNGKSASLFDQMLKVLKDNFGQEISSSAILLGNKPGRNSATSYLYKFIKLGFVEPLKNGFAMDESTRYIVKRKIPEHYNSVMFGDEMKLSKGLIPDTRTRKIY